LRRRKRGKGAAQPTATGLRQHPSKPDPISLLDPANKLAESERGRRARSQHEEEDRHMSRTRPDPSGISNHTPQCAGRWHRRTGDRYGDSRDGGSRIEPIIEPRWGHKATGRSNEAGSRSNDAGSRSNDAGSGSREASRSSGGLPPSQMPSWPTALAKRPRLLLPTARLSSRGPHWHARTMGVSRLDGSAIQQLCHQLDNWIPIRPL
jgi:hypothetical protein